MCFKTETGHGYVYRWRRSSRHGANVDIVTPKETAHDRKTEPHVFGGNR